MAIFVSDNLTSRAYLKKENVAHKVKIFREELNKFLIGARADA